MEVKIQIPDNCELIKNGDTYIVKEKKQALPKTWKEFCESYPINTTEYFIDGNSNIRRRCTFGVALREVSVDKNQCSSEEEAEAFLALMQLRQLRKAWVGDWNFSGSDYYAIIFSSDTGLKIGEYIYTHRALSFPTPEMAEDFLNCFKDLCETSKILL